MKPFIHPEWLRYILIKYFSVVGYVLSKEALKRFVEDALPNTNNCTKGHVGAEDVEMGKQLSMLFTNAIDPFKEIMKNLAF